MPSRNRHGLLDGRRGFLHASVFYQVVQGVQNEQGMQPADLVVHRGDDLFDRRGEGSVRRGRTANSGHLPNLPALYAEFPAALRFGIPRRNDEETARAACDGGL